MLSWLRGKVSRDSSFSRDGLQYDSVSRDDVEGKNTLVVVRDAALPKMTLESNELQLLQDIPEFKPLISEGEAQPMGKVDTKSLLAICKVYQEHLHSNAEIVAGDQQVLLTKMKEIDMTVKVLMDRLTERQKSYAKVAEQMHKTRDITLSLKKLRSNVKETEEMLRQLNEQLPEDLQLGPFHFVETRNRPD